MLSRLTLLAQMLKKHYNCICLDKHLKSGDNRVLKSALSKLLGEKQYIKIKTFTYYVPSPPDRKTGYQEKEFDQITSYLIGKDFDIVDFKMQACANDKSSGVWILCILGAKTKEAADLVLDIDYNSIIHSSDQPIKMDPSIEHDH